MKVGQRDAAEWWKRKLQEARTSTCEPRPVLSAPSQTGRVRFDARAVIQGLKHGDGRERPRPGRVARGRQCLRVMLAQGREDRDKLQQERDNWRGEAELLCAEKLLDAKLRKADERRFASPEPEHRP
jgi:hypothetical protein